MGGGGIFVVFLFVCAFCFLRQGLLVLAVQELCSQKWPQTHRHPPECVCMCGSTGPESWA